MSSPDLTDASPATPAGADGRTNAEAEITALEAVRCKLLGAGDLGALALLLDDDYRHVHGNGRVTDKAATLARLGTRSRLTERGDLTVRVWDDTALLLGEQVNRSHGANGVEQISRGMVTQTLRRRSGRWLFMTLQFTPVQD